MRRTPSPQLSQAGAASSFFIPHKPSAHAPLAAPQVWHREEEEERKSLSRPMYFASVRAGKFSPADGNWPKPFPCLTQVPFPRPQLLIFFPSSGRGNTYRVLELLVVFTVISPRPPLFFCNRTRLWSEGANDVSRLCLCEGSTEQCFSPQNTALVLLDSLLWPTVGQQLESTWPCMWLPHFPFRDKVSLWHAGWPRSSSASLVLPSG